MNNTVNKLILDRESCEKLHKKLRFADPVFITPGFEAQYSETTDASSPTVAKPETTVPTTKAKAPTSNYLFFCFYL